MFYQLGSCKWLYETLGDCSLLSTLLCGADMRHTVKTISDIAESNVGHPKLSTKFPCCTNFLPTLLCHVRRFGDAIGDLVQCVLKGFCCFAAVQPQAVMAAAM